MAGFERLQNEDFKSAATLVSDGGSASQLLNDVKVYLTALALNKTLYQAIVDGDLSGGGGSTDFNKIVTADGNVVVDDTSGNVVYIA